VPGVFLSYSRADRGRAELLIQGLRGLGVDAWWDEDMPGVDWQAELARQINSLSAVIVLWTPHSIESKNVRDEARLGQHEEKLVNAMIGVSAPPFPFERNNGLPLDGWTGREKHNGWARLVKTIDDMFAQTGAGSPGELTARLASRERTIAEKQAALSQAEEAYRAAKSDEAAAADAWVTASAACAAAQQQLGWVVDRNGSPALLRAAQTDLNTTLAAQEEADTARKACAEQLAAASRNVTRAKRELERVFEETTGPQAPGYQSPPVRASAAEPAAPPSPAPPSGPKAELAAMSAAPDPPAQGAEDQVLATDELGAAPSAHDPVQAPQPPAPAEAPKPPPTLEPRPVAAPVYRSEFDDKARRRAAILGAMVFVAAILLWGFGLGADAAWQGSLGLAGFLVAGASFWLFSRSLTYTRRNTLDGSSRRMNPCDPWVTGIVITLCFLAGLICIAPKA
jgi:hypothetical protein